MQLILISGLAGAGKSTALKILEDSGYYCIDNLPPPMLKELINIHNSSGVKKIAVSIDTRSHSMLHDLPKAIAEILKSKIELKIIFLDARNEILITRFSETRRKHPLSDGNKTVSDCILEERGILREIESLGYKIDTSDLTANNLRNIIKEFVQADYSQLNIIIQSFGYKYGLPVDSDFVFDVRCLINPYYDTNIRDLTGLDEPIIFFLKKEDKVNKMINDIYNMVSVWLDDFSKDNRNYLTISIGCTGGRHRSVYITEELAKLIKQTGYKTLIRHRQL